MSTPDSSLTTHVDDFIDGHCGAHEYARWVLNHFRLSAMLRSDFDQFMQHHKLFCTYKGKRYRVTGASRMGDVWLTQHFDRPHGYEHRVMPNEVSDWSPTPEPSSESI